VHEVPVALRGINDAAAEAVADQEARIAVPTEEVADGDARGVEEETLTRRAEAQDGRVGQAGHGVRELVGTGERLRRQCRAECGIDDLPGGPRPTTRS
jgi:hypothetical protein